MAINIKFDELGIFGIIVGITGAVVAGIMTKKTNDISRKLGKSIDDLDRRTVVQVRQDIVDRATANAVDRQVSGAVTRAVNEINAQMKMDMRSKIHRDVDGVYGDLKKKVKDKVFEEIENTDFDELREEALDEAKDLAKDKIFDDFCRWGDVGKIFGNVVTGREVDMDDLFKVVELVPYDKRAEVLTSIFGKRR